MSSSAKVLAFVLGAGSSLAPTLAAAEDARIVVRSIGVTPSAAVVRFIGTNASPTRVSANEFPEMSKLTPEQVASRLCGMVQDGYSAVLAEINNPTPIPSGQPLGALAYSVAWPACIRVQDSAKFKVRKGDNFTSIRLLLTGEKAVDAGLKPYFAKTGAPYAPGNLIPEGTVLNLPFQTFRTTLRVPPAAVAAGFETQLKTVGGRQIEITSYPKVAGRIAPPGSSGSFQAAEDDCTSTGDDDYPYRPAAVVKALEWLKSLPAPSFNIVTVAVADNGFFGVPCRPDMCPVTDGEALHPSDRFPPTVFAPENFYQGDKQWVGPVEPTARLFPVNYGHGVKATDDITEYSGHGTHVAALTMGGPLFQVPINGVKPRDALVIGGENKLRLSVFALAQGTEDLDIGAQDTLDRYLRLVSHPAVVNMSLIFDTALDDKVESAFTRILAANLGDTLFVAAAGNQDAPLDDGRLQPAAMGGPGRSNLMTVASVDAGGQLSKFSNRGAKRVDIAAPGCHISSWLDADSEEVPLSGTSQAAAVASFAAGLLAVVTPYHPPRVIKNRLFISGDLLADDASRSGVASMSRLNIAKALYFKRDYIRFTPPGQPEKSYLGTLTQTTVLCAGAEVDFSKLWALKRVDAGNVIIFKGSLTGEINACSTTLPASLEAGGDNLIHFQPEWVGNGDGFDALPAGQPGLDIPAAQISEIIRRSDGG